MIKNITVLAGDGVGAEITQQSIKVLNAVALHFNHQFIYTDCLIGAVAIAKTGNSLPDKTIEICLAADAILFGTVENASYNNGLANKVYPQEGLLRLRKILGLFAEIRPLTIYSSLQHLSPLKSKIIAGVDLIIFSELSVDHNNSAIDLNITHASLPNVDESLTINIEKIAHAAFSAASKRRKKLTLVDKVNVYKTPVVWRNVVKKVGLNYPDVVVNFLPLENAMRQIMLNPKQFDIILTDNLLGDILNDEATNISGSSGLLPCASIGNIIGLFSPVNGIDFLAEGKDIANPIGSILSVAMMLDYFNLREEAQMVRDAVEWTIESLFVSKDLDPINFYFTSTIGELISEYIGGRISGRVNWENIELRKSTII